MNISPSFFIVPEGKKSVFDNSISCFCLGCVVKSGKVVMIVKYLLVVSTLDIDPSVYKPNRDPLNLKPFSDPLLISAKDETMAISEFVESEFFKQYCNEHYSSRDFFIYCKGEHDSVYHKANAILLDL